MLLLHSYDIVFQEVPDEISLGLWLAGCPNRCVGCHSAHLREASGEALTVELLGGLVDRYKGQITCVCFLGGDADPKGIEKLAKYVRSLGYKVAWYSGRAEIPPEFDVLVLDYLKLGPYIAELGALTSPTTNQRFYRIEKGELTDISYLFHRK